MLKGLPGNQGVELGEYRTFHHANRVLVQVAAARQSGESYGIETAVQIPLVARTRVGKALRRFIPSQKAVLGRAARRCDGKSHELAGRCVYQPEREIVPFDEVGRVAWRVVGQLERWRRVCDGLVYRCAGQWLKGWLGHGRRRVDWRGLGYGGGQVGGRPSPIERFCLAQKRKPPEQA